MSAGTPTPQTLTYADIVEVDLASNNVNFADVEDYGHRVVIHVLRSGINNFLGWERLVNTDRPKAKILTAGETDFKAQIKAAIGRGFQDIDGVTTGLHFGSTHFDTNPDTRKRAVDPEGFTRSANDIPLCFILYKLYGKSTADTLGKIFNLEDSHGMLTNDAVANAITDAFKGLFDTETNTTGTAKSVDTMFRDLLAADPYRFFDASGVPQAGIFETNADSAGSGSWNLTVDDIIEVKLKLVFNSNVTRRGVAGREHNLTATDADALQENQQTVIEPNDFFYVRLQLKCKNDGPELAVL
jgi:hypothetical protein